MSASRKVLIVCVALLSVAGLVGCQHAAPAPPVGSYHYASNGGPGLDEFIKQHHPIGFPGTPGLPPDAAPPTAGGMKIRVGE